ncbi:nucleotide sugar dehydrogenase [Natronomonas sp. CBA1123]|uniref:nucleotide sugar dehydrogenase n=1 Tax=Natronomonas sp. CBA1123 TaxID=2668070 RepID=UPI0012E9FF1A|nr:nucleotide sugar dehydrogenase [Natronomonas sp. CBA1123]MUV86257.1 nucleotide sugar dehydrogenase [Natronomonas sp. CBA1123]
MSETVDSRRVYGTDAAEVGERFRNGAFPVAVYGLGKMGLPLAAVLADVSGNVVGADIDSSVVESVNEGACHVVGEPGLEELVAETVESGALRAVADGKAAASEASMHVVVVPTLLTDNNRPDLAAVESVLEDVATGLEPGDFVVIESTVPPRTCSDAVVPQLAEQSGVDPDEFGVAFCPERTSSGRALVDIRESYPKIVGGVDDESTRLAAEIYDEVTTNEVVPVSDSTTAEATKVFGGVYRDVNIAFANELATYADDLAIDVREAIAASNSQPHSHILEPGPGVGGHCIPVYPYFLLNEFDVYSPIIRMSRAVNDSMPTFVVKQLRRALSEAGTGLQDSTVLVLGVTYRAGVEETRFSPALTVLELLSDFGAETLAVDPLLDDIDGDAELLSQEAAAASDLDAVVLVTPHEAFETFPWNDHDDLVVVDTRGVLDPDTIEGRVVTIGRAMEE